MAVKIITADTPGGIEAQEARGQRELAESTSLPSDMGERGAELFTALGGVIEGPVAGDPLFVNVKLPTGWSKAPTTHPMLSELRDERGRQRARIFYNAAVCDRRARMSFVPRFVLRWRHGDAAAPYPADYVEVLDASSDTAGAVVYQSPRLPVGQLDWPVRDERLRSLEKDVEAWMDEHVRGWRDPIRSWEVDTADVVVATT